MIAVLVALLPTLLGVFKTRAELHLEILALRHQLALLRMRGPLKPRFRPPDRALWVMLSRLWSRWTSALVVVKPDTVLRWHRKGFRLFWTWKSRRRGPGRPAVAEEVRQLIHTMSAANPLWGAPRIHGELAKLGISVSQASVAKYMAPRSRRDADAQRWKTFIKNHSPRLVAADFFVVPTAFFRLLFVFVVMTPDRRRILHVNVTDHPSEQWTAQQIIDTFPLETATRFLLRDRDSTYGEYFRRRVRNMGIEEVLTAAHSPWQNGHVERLIGSFRRDCLDHVIVLDERHPMRLIREYVDHYHADRTHLALAKDTPDGRPVEPPSAGRVVARPVLGGLHHRYLRRAA